MPMLNKLQVSLLIVANKGDKVEKVIILLVGETGLNPAQVDGAFEKVLAFTFAFSSLLLFFVVQSLQCKDVLLYDGFERNG